jgi:cell division protein FtsB
MKKTTILFPVIIIVMMMGCGKDRVSERLIQIDSLLTADKVDSAKILLGSIPMSDLQSKKDSAFYYLMQTEIQCRKWIPAKSDTAINYSVEYYKGTTDHEKIARAYYYKSVSIYDFRKPSASILLLKQAEEQADYTSNLTLKHKIYEKLSYFNSYAHEYKVGLLYSQKALEIAKQLNDKEREAIALLYMASDYSFLDNHDSLAICIQECLPLATYLTEYESAFLYTRVGELYAKNDPEIAKKYLLKAIESHPQPSTYKTLSAVYLLEDSFDKAKNMWIDALKNTNNEKTSTVRTDIFKAMRQQSMEQEDYRQANILADSIILRQQKYYKAKEQDRISEVQAKYDKEAAERSIKERVMVWSLVLLLIVAAIIGWLGYGSWRGMKAKKDLAETRLQLEIYTQKAADLEIDQQENASEIKKLNKKIEDLHYRQSGILAKGRELFETIAEGGTTVHWGKDDFINYLEYYKLKDLPFVNEMETNYNHLSPKYIFFAVLEHEGHDDEDIQHIMGISESTLRSTRSRINSKKLSL